MVPGIELGYAPGKARALNPVPVLPLTQNCYFFQGWGQHWVTHRLTPNCTQELLLVGLRGLWCRGLSRSPIFKPGTHPVHVGPESKLL